MERIIQSILDAMVAVFQLGDEQVFVSASIGITVYPEDATEVENLFKYADQALYVAKGAGRNRFSIFTPALQESAQTRARLTNDLRAGLAQDQFLMVYQPIVELATVAIYKAEALIRWQHPTRGPNNGAPCCTRASRSVSTNRQSSFTTPVPPTGRGLIACRRLGCQAPRLRWRLPRAFCWMPAQP